jgi:hypothetical protein
MMMERVSETTDSCSELRRLFARGDITGILHDRSPAKRLNFVVEWLIINFCIREVPASYLGPEAGYPG